MNVTVSNAVRKWVGRAEEGAATALPRPEWLSGKEFSQEWTLIHLGTWNAVFAPFRREVRDILEIGSWEGMSALYFLNFFPECSITCVDTFAGSAEHKDPSSPSFAVDLLGVEGRFDRNTSEYGDRVSKIKVRSACALDALAEQHRAFDLIYVDGSHRRADVMADSVLCWCLLRVGGILIWDDWRWCEDAPSEEKPKDAIDLFRRAFSPCMTTLHSGYQLIVRKTGEWPIR